MAGYVWLIGKTQGFEEYKMPCQTESIFLIFFLYHYSSFYLEL